MQLQSRPGNVIFIRDDQGPLKNCGIYFYGKRKWVQFHGVTYQSQPHLLTTKLSNGREINIFCNVWGMIDFPLS